MAYLFDPRYQAISASALPYAGAKLHFYQAGTSTPITVYQDEGGTTPHTNPVTADSSGTFPAVFMTNTTNYKIILKDAGGVTLDTIDNIPPGALDLDTLNAAVERAEAYAAMLSADKIRFATVADLLADTVMSYTAGEGLIEVGPPDVIDAQGFRYEVAASDATDFHVESAGNVKLYALPGEDGYSVLQWGAVADVDLTVDRVNWTGATDNTATMLAALADIIARDGGGVIHSPPGCLVDYSGVDVDTAAGMTIIDDSHIDYARPAITSQSTRYMRQFTALSELGAANGNGQVNSGNHNPHFAVESRAAEGTQSARASYVFWHDDAQADAQLVYDRATAGAPFFSINSYGSLVNGTTLLSIAGQGHPYFRQVAVNTGFYPSATLTWFLAGHSTDGDYLTKAFLEVYSLPASSTGDFTKLFRVGSTVKARQYVMNDGAFQWWASNSGTPRMVYSATGELYGHRRLVKNVTTNASLAVNDSGQHATNVDAGGGAVLTLPAAAVGLHYSFSVDSANNLRIDPNGTDLFVNMAAGKYMESATIGSECSVTCVKAGVWTFRRSGTWTDEA